MLSPQELKRYNRHIILPEFGLSAQEKLKKARVLVVGAGGLGCPILSYLTAAGIGTIGIIDDDTVDESNLQRQVLFDVNDIGHLKAEAAVSKLSLQNPNIGFEVCTERLNNTNAIQLFSNYDLIIDGSDNFQTRYLVNDACVITKKPFIYGAIFKFDGQVSVFNLNEGPTYRCLFPEPPLPGEVPNCSEIGVIGVLPGVIGSLQAAEAIKVISGIGEPLSGKMKHLDVLTMESNIFSFSKNENINITELINYDSFCGIETPKKDQDIKSVTTKELSVIMGMFPTLILDVREPHELEICKIEGSLHIPLNTIPTRVTDIPKDQKIYVICHHGMRSASAIKFLEENFQYTQLYNIEGGINSWAEEVDNEMLRY